jgi:hypothetical protein
MVAFWPFPSSESSKTISGDKDIHSLLGVAREKVGDLPLNMCSTFQSNNYDNISKRILLYAHFYKGLTQMDTKTQGMNRKFLGIFGLELNWNKTIAFWCDKKTTQTKLS